MDIPTWLGLTQFLLVHFRGFNQEVVQQTVATTVWIQVLPRQRSRLALGFTATNSSGWVVIPQKACNSFARTWSLQTWGDTNTGEHLLAEQKGWSFSISWLRQHVW